MDRDLGQPLDTRPLWQKSRSTPETIGLVQEEIELLKKAAKEPSSKKKIDLIYRGFEKRQKRYEVYSKNNENHFRNIEPIGETLEGVAEWIRFKLILGSKRFEENKELSKADKNFKNYSKFKKMNNDQAFDFVINNRNKWEKQLGFLMVVLLDQLDSEWKSKIHSAKPYLAETLLYKNLLGPNSVKKQ